MLYSEALKQQLFGIINRDYKDFITITTKVNRFKYLLSLLLLVACKIVARYLVLVACCLLLVLVAFAVAWCLLLVACCLLFVDIEFLLTYKLKPGRGYLPRPVKVLA